MDNMNAEQGMADMTDEERERVMREIEAKINTIAGEILRKLSETGKISIDVTGVSDNLALGLAMTAFLMPGGAKEETKT